MHVCPVPTPVPPHGPGYVIDGSQTVLVNGLPLCRQGDTVLEALGGPEQDRAGRIDRSRRRIGPTGQTGASIASCQGAREAGPLPLGTSRFAG